MAIIKSHTRSISLPTRSNPITLQIEEQLNKIQTLEASNRLCALVELYKSIDDLLNLPQTLQNAKCVDEILECPVKLLDVCGIIIDVVSQLKENIRDIQSSMRRRKGDSSVETSINKYRSFNKKMKKDAKKCIATLKKMEQTMESSVDEQVSSVITLIKKVNAFTISTFQNVLGFLSTSSKSKSNKWSFFNKQRVVCESQQMSLNELEVVENSLSTKSATIQEDLEKLESAIEGIERGVESMSRCLIKSRTILLNVVSC